MSCPRYQIRKITSIESLNGRQSVQMDEVASKMKRALEPLRSFMESTFTPVNGTVRPTMRVTRRCHVV